MFILWFGVLLLSQLALESTAIEDIDRFDCYPEVGVTEAKCKARKCLWKLRPHGAKTVMPECFYDSSINYGYEYTGRNSTKNGFVTSLMRSNTLPTNGTYRNPITSAIVAVEGQTEARLRITIRDGNRRRYEVPVQANFPKARSKLQYATVAENSSNGYSFSVTRKNGKSIFDTRVGALVLSDQFLQISAKLNSIYCYGFGEHEHQSFALDFNWTKLGMFSRDQPPSKGANLYGVHPFYMCLEADGKAHGVLLLNSNAMDVTLQPSPAITFRTIGGVLDFFFFLGPTPADVVNQYTELIGTPFMPPYWSLGFQLCRYGYNNLATVKKTVDRMKEYNIPQDVQYGDIDYMERQLDFTVNNKTYNGLSQYVRDLKKDGIRYITILDPAISANETAGTYPPYDLGNKMDIWIKDHTGSAVLYGKVWPDLPNVTVDETKPWDYQTKNYRAHAVFPDFTHPKIGNYWGKLITDFHKNIEFDGIWIDMNEPASFVAGSVNGCPAGNSLETPPYKPGILGSTLADKTICMSAKHWNGEVEYNLHSLFGWSQSEPTFHAAAKATGKRALVISRSTYPSSGKFAGHWLGDNYSGWSQMKTSIVGMLEFGLFGIPYIGADICGFFKDTDEDLCQKWMALGAFYPFSRNHNGKGNKEQDPAFFGAVFAKKARDVLLIRYNLLPYLYTLFYNSHKTGAPIVRPLFFEFPGDRKTWKIDEQFMWGNALLITPILRKNQNVSLTAYFPPGTWYDYYTGMEQWKKGNVTLPITSDKQIFLHVRGGSILPTQNPSNNTMFSRRNPMGLIIGLDSSHKATGSLFWDDGESNDSISNNKFQMFSISANPEFCTINLVTNGYPDAGRFNIEHITLLGALPYLSKNDIHKNSITVNGAAAKDAKGIAVNHKSIKITGLKLPLSKSHIVRWKLSSSSMVEANSMIIMAGLFLASVWNQLSKE